MAQNHYLQVTDAHFAQASAELSDKPRDAAHNPAQYPSVTSIPGREQSRQPNEKAPALPELTERYNSLPDEEIAAAGLEPATQGL